MDNIFNHRYRKFSDAISSFPTIKWNELLKFCPTSASTTRFPLISSSIYTQKDPWLIFLICYLVSWSTISSCMREWMDRTDLKKSRLTLTFLSDI